MEDRLQPSALNSGNDLNDYPAHQGKFIWFYEICLSNTEELESAHLIMQT